MNATTLELAAVYVGTFSVCFLVAVVITVAATVWVEAKSTEVVDVCKNGCPVKGDQVSDFLVFADSDIGQKGAFLCFTIDMSARKVQVIESRPEEKLFAYDLDGTIDPITGVLSFPAMHTMVAIWDRATDTVKAKDWPVTALREREGPARFMTEYNLAQSFPAPIDPRIVLDADMFAAALCLRPPALVEGSVPFACRDVRGYVDLTNRSFAFAAGKSNLLIKGHFNTTVSTWAGTGTIDNKDADPFRLAFSPASLGFKLMRPHGNNLVTHGLSLVEFIVQL